MSLEPAPATIVALAAELGDHQLDQRRPARRRSSWRPRRSSPQTTRPCEPWASRCRPERDRGVLVDGAVVAAERRDHGRQQAFVGTHGPEVWHVGRLTASGRETQSARDTRAHGRLLEHASGRLGSDPRACRVVEQLGRLSRAQRHRAPRAAIARAMTPGIGDMVAALEADQGLAADLLRYANSRRLRAPTLRAARHPRAVTLVGAGRSRSSRRGRDRSASSRTPAGNGRPLPSAICACTPPASPGRPAIAERTGAAGRRADLERLLHDVGKLVAAASLRQAVERAMRRRARRTSRAERAERQSGLGVDHAAAGGWRAPLRRDRAAGRDARSPPPRAATKARQNPVAEAACVSIADEIAACARAADPTTALLGSALEVARARARTSTTCLEAVPAGNGRRRRRPPASPSSSARRASTALTGAAQPPALDGDASRRACRPRASAAASCSATCDHFKAVNDEFGHATGDRRSPRSRASCPRQGTAGRLGSESVSGRHVAGPRRRGRPQRSARRVVARVQQEVGLVVARQHRPAAPRPARLGRAQHDGRRRRRRRCGTAEAAASRAEVEADEGARL